MQKGIRRLGNQQFMNNGLVPWGTQKEEPWREVAGKLSTWQEGISSHGKNDKGKGSQKLILKMWGLEALKEEGPKVSYLRTPHNGKSTRDFWGRNSKKIKLWGMRKGPATNVTGTTLVLVLREQMGGINDIPRTLGWHYKEEKQTIVKGSQQQWIRVKSLRKLY